MIGPSDADGRVLYGVLTRSYGCNRTSISERGSIPSFPLGSLADTLGCTKKRSLYPSKQTLPGVGIVVR